MTARRPATDGCVCRSELVSASTRRGDYEQKSKPSFAAWFSQAVGGRRFGGGAPTVGGRGGAVVSAAAGRDLAERAAWHCAGRLRRDGAGRCEECLPFRPGRRTV